MHLEQEKSDFDNAVRRHVYDHVMQVGLPPTITETSSACARSAVEVRDSFHRSKTMQLSRLLSQYSLDSSCYVV